MEDTSAGSHKANFCEVKDIFKWYGAITLSSVFSIHTHTHLFIAGYSSKVSSINNIHWLRKKPSQLLSTH